MLKKIVVFDGNFGGELFADYIENELAVVDVIRVIDWRNSNIYLNKPHDARKTMLKTLRHYIGRVDVIIIANIYLSAIGLEFLKNKFPNQKFIGFDLQKIFHPARSKRVIIITTKNLRSIPAYQLCKYKLHAKTQEFDCDKWIDNIDDGELSADDINRDLAHLAHFNPHEIILANTTLVDIKTEIKNILGVNTKIYDGFKTVYHNLCIELGFRGNDGRKNK